MLNRRSLRIKVMQFLYALERHKEAYQLIARDKAGSNFDPNLNSDEPQDTKILGDKKKETLKAFDESFASLEKIKGQYSEDISDAVQNGISLYDDLLNEQKKMGLKRLIEETSLVASRYVNILYLPVAWKEIILEEWNAGVGEGKNLKAGYRNLASNPMIEAIENDAAIKKLRSKSNEICNTETIHEWYRKLIRKDEVFEKYSEIPNAKDSDHYSVIDHIFKNIVFKSEVINSYMEENDLGWSENRGILKSMVIKTLKTYDAEKKSIQMINLSPNWEEDEQFYQELYKKTIQNDDQLEKIIADKSRNWEVDRIAAVDMVIMKLALTEFINFPSIPVKVTINEYIEICKMYSTPKSKIYINGILDVVSNELKTEGLIKKSGRGLLDNK